VPRPAVRAVMPRAGGITARMRVVAALVGVQSVRPPAARPSPGLDGGAGLHQRLRADAVVGVGGRCPDGEGEAVAVGHSVDLAAGFAVVDGAGPVGAPPFRPRGRGGGGPGPVDQPLRAGLVQRGGVQPPPQAGRGPGDEPAVRGGLGGSEPRWQVPPRAAGGQHVHDRSEYRPGVDRRAAPALQTARRRRGQRGRQVPQLIRHPR
jgi:hypothetical protein